MLDIQDACNLVDRTVGEIGMTEEDRQKANDLLTAYGEERDGLLEGMLTLLGKADTSDLRSNWMSYCEKGKDLLEKVDRGVPSTDNDAGLKGIGAGDFAAGERKIWEENAKADIAFVADVISQIYVADVELIQKCNEELKNVREGDVAVEELIQSNLHGLTGQVKDLIITFAAKKAPAIFKIWMKDGSAKIYVDQWSQLIGTYLTENLKAAKQKRLYKQQIASNIDLLEKAKGELSGEWIDEIYGKGSAFADLLYLSGQSGDYKAADWAKFGISCIEILGESRDRSKAQSQKLFDELLPTFLDENSRAFAAITDDPAVLDTWRSEMETDFQSVEDLLAAQDEVINALAEGPYMQALRATFEDLASIVRPTQKALLDATEAAEGEFKQ